MIQKQRSTDEMNKQLDELLAGYKEQQGEKFVDEAIDRLYKERQASFTSLSLPPPEDRLIVSAKHTVLTAYETIDAITNQTGRMYDAEFGGHLPWLTLSYRLLGAGGQALVSEGTIDFEKLDKEGWLRLLAPRAAWGLAEFSNDEIPEEAYKTVRRIPRTFIKDAMEVLQDQTLKQLSETGRAELRKIKGLVRKDKDGEKARVAVKIVSPNGDAAARKQLEARAKRELNMAGRDTENSVTMLMHGKTQGNKLYTVAKMIKDPLNWYDAPREMSLDDKVRVVTALAEEIADFSEIGVVHRDIKPQNIMLQRSRRTVHQRFLFWTWDKTIPATEANFIDWGLMKYNKKNGQAKADTVYLDKSFATTEQTVMGTPDYIAPEQAHSLTESDTRSDLCSLGLTLYFYLTGRSPNHNMPDDRRNDPSDRMYNSKHREHKPEAPEVNKYLVLVTAALMQKDPNYRYQKPEDAVEDLKLIQQGKKPKRVYAQIKASNDIRKVKDEPTFTAESYIEESFRHAPFMGVSKQKLMAWGAAAVAASGIAAGSVLTKPGQEFWINVGNKVKELYNTFF